MRKKDNYDELFKDNHCWNCPVMDLDLCHNCHYYIDFEDIKFDFQDTDIDDNIYDYDNCSICKYNGDNKYINSKGKMVNRCKFCFINN